MSHLQNCPLKHIQFCWGPLKIHFLYACLVSSIFRSNLTYIICDLLCMCLSYSCLWGPASFFSLSIKYLNRNWERRRSSDIEMVRRVQSNNFKIVCKIVLLWPSIQGNSEIEISLVSPFSKNHRTMLVVCIKFLLLQMILNIYNINGCCDNILFNTQSKRTKESI